jgi:hypothetical protein
MQELNILSDGCEIVLFNGVVDSILGHSPTNVPTLVTPPA